MPARIFSQVAGSRHYLPPASLLQVLAFFASVVLSHHVIAQGTASSRPGYFTDPQTGIVYRKVSKTIERPVVETKMETKQETVYRPEVVTETKPENQTVYTPVVQYKWEPRLHGRWNPFQQPTVAYHHVPTARWEARNQVIQKTNKRTNWVAESRTTQVPRQTVRMKREHKIEYEAVGQVAKPTPAATPSISNAVAARLRPLTEQTRVIPLGASSTSAYASTVPRAPGRFQDSPRIAASTVGRMASDPPRRNTGQGGLRATELMPSHGHVRGQALPPSTGGIGIANLPSLPFMR